MSLLLSAFHYLALAIGFSGIVLRGLGFRDALQGASLQRVYLADNLWGVGALLWIGTGLLRAFGGFEKGTDYYLQSHWFWLKMALFGLVFLLEFWPMMTLIRWRIQKKKNLGSEDHSRVQRFVWINTIETVLVLLIPFVAVVMARGGIYL